ncbi:MAG: FtsX-like permease family protein [Prolixibacteraceae bacterium]|nr:FtsX-like permease family protein [Prolixibacteraceae bacterium]
MRNKFYSMINIVGLAIGITACILIMLYVQSELSYDTFHEKADRIYRVNLYGVLNDDEINQPHTSPPLAKAMQNEIPEVEEAVRLTFAQPVIRHNNDVFNEKRWCFGDANFFKIFSASFINGNPENALSQPNSVVLTESTAMRYFGKDNPIGQFIPWENDRDYQITGVIKDYPENSHIKLDFLASIKGQDIDNNMQWIHNMVYTYILIKEGYTTQDVDAKLEGLVKKYVGPAIMQLMGVSFEDALAQGIKYRWYAQPLGEIHFDRNVSQGPEPLGNKSYMLIFSIIAIFILVIACINYMNMSTALSANRAKEVGIKKSLGSNRKSLILQFLSESVLVTLIALALALILITLLLPGFNNLIEKQLVINYFGNFKVIPLLVAFGIGIGIIAGSYPAFFLASFNPVKVIKGINKSEGGHGKLRSGLVIFQLIVSIVLFSGTFFISKQLSFLQNKNLGFNKENLVIINKSNYLGNQMSSFKNELLAQSGILEITNTSSIPGRINSGSTFFHHSVNDSRGMNTIWSDCDFLKTYQIELTEGRFFEEGNQFNAKSVVLNETAIKRLNIEDPIGKKVYQGKKTEDESLTIIGVMKDFHCESLHQEMSSLVLINGTGENLSVRVSGDIQQNLKIIEQTWDNFTNGQSLDYVFFDEDFGRLYKAEVRTRKIVSIFSALAILIACLGLLALAAFVAEQRTKEIGVRKVNGARIGEILLSLNRNFMKWVGIAFIIAVPGSWYLLNNWLGNFAYKTNLSWWVFALAGVAALFVTMLTVTWISWKAATRNPVEALRYE